MTLLVLNDDPVQLRLAVRVLERAGYHVLTASNARDGLEILQDHLEVEGVLTDLNMPDIDGWRFCRLLRSPEYARFNDLPVLVVSATYAGDDAARLTAELGAQAFLPVPYKASVLVDHVERMLNGTLPAAQLAVVQIQEDEARSRRLGASFQRHGYRVAAARTLAEGRKLLAGDPVPRIVVLDHHLPDGAAGELLRDIKRPGSATVAVVVTREHEPKLALELMQQGADGTVSRAFDPQYVITLCERALRQRSLFRIQELLEERTRSLRESEARLRAMLHAMRDIVLVCDKDGAILYANPAAERALGSPAARSLDEIADGRTYRTVDGGRIEVDVTVSPIRFEGIEATLSLARDIGGRRRTEEERALLAEAVEQATDMIVVSDAEGRIHYANPAFERITGHSRKEAAGAPVDILRADDGRWEERDRAAARGESWHGRVCRRRKDGGAYVAEGTYSPVRDASGEVVHYVTVERDVTQDERREIARRQGQKMEAIGTLAGGIAHDFNNLLTCILGYADLLENEAEPGSDVAQMARVIGSSASRAAELTKQLLGFARRGKYRNVPVDLHETVGQVVRLLDRTIDKRISIRADLMAGPATAIGDPSQMEQALLNLALNARDAMSSDDKGELLFETARVVMDEAYCAGHPGASPGTYVAVAVTDSGCGMPPDVQARVFEPFFTTKQPGEGTGMGLSMVYGIVKNHGGSIRVYSEPGHGTTFKVYLPLVELKPMLESIEEPTDLVRGSGRVLVVDDEKVVRQAVTSMLRQLGYDVITAADGEEAVVYYRTFSESIDLVVVDMVMPGLGGRECFSALKEINPGVRAVLATGFGLNDAAQAILDDGVLGFAQKPFRLAQLSRVVAAALEGERYDTRDRAPSR